MIDLEFIKAGNAVFTFSNPKGERYTFKIAYSKHMKRHFAYVLTGPSNLYDYTYLGMLMDNDFVIPTKKSKYTKDSTPMKVINYAIKIVKGKHRLLDGYFLEHNGHCGKCGRPLTTPESIKNGIGPICREK